MKMTVFNDIGKMKEAGFSGFVKMKELFVCQTCVPKQPGIYFVLKPKGMKADFLEEGTGGYFKGNNPNVMIGVLKENWIDDSLVLYIGRSSDLKRRMKQLVKFGQRENIGHWGGRYLWQIRNSEELIVCWRMLSENDDVKKIKKYYLENFKKEYKNNLPFANLEMR